MATFYDIIKRVAHQVTDARSGIATGGSTTALVDTSRDEPDDFFNGGWLFIDHAVPVIVKITDYVQSTGTFTFATSTAVTANTKYTVIDERIPLDVIKNAINQALIEDIGQIMGIDETLTGVDGQERYILLDGVYDVRRVEVGEEDGDWDIHYWWTEELGELRFLHNLPDEDETIRLHYVHTHDELIDLDDEIDTQVSLDLLVHTACAYCLQWRLTHVRENEPALPDKLSFHESRAMMARSRNKVRLLNRDPILARF